MPDTILILQHAEHIIPYEVKFARRKTMVLQVGLDLTVKVRAPYRIKTQFITDFVKQRAEWIVKKRTEFAALPRPLNEQYEHGGIISYLGDPYQVQVIPDALKPHVELRDQLLQIHVVDQTIPACVKKEVIRWYRAQAKQVFGERLVICYESVKSLGVPTMKTWQIRKMKARWGSCRKNGNITLNETLIKLPLSLIDYVITHELCHLKEFNHSKNFYVLLSAAMPDWASRREQLFQYILK